MSPFPAALLLQIGVCVLVSAAAVISVLLVWRDDHKWMERNDGAEPVAEPRPYPLDLHELWPPSVPHHHS